MPPIASYMAACNWNRGPAHTKCSRCRSQRRRRRDHEWKWTNQQENSRISCAANQLSLFKFFFSSKPTFSGNGSNGSNIGYTNWRFICVQISEMRRKANKTLVPDTKRHHNNWQALRCLVSIGLSFCLSVCHRGCRRLWRRRRPHRPRLRCYLCTSLCVFAIIRFVAGRIQVNAQCITHCLAIYRLQTQEKPATEFWMNVVWKISRHLNSVRVSVWIARNGFINWL